MVAAFPVLGLVVNGRTMNFHFAGGEVTLEICHVIHGIPQAELYIGKNGKLFGVCTVVGQGQLVNFAVSANWNESGQFGVQAVFAALKCGVAHAVAAFIGIKVSLGRHPARIPDAVPFFDVIVVAVTVIWDIVVTVSCQAQQLCVLVKAVASAGVGNQGKEVFRSEIVNPWKRCFRRCNDILLVCIIKIAKFHVCILQYMICWFGISDIFQEILRSCVTFTKTFK